MFDVLEENKHPKYGTELTRGRRGNGWRRSKTRQHRLELGYNLRELGKKLHITFSSISNYENGKTLIQSDILISLCKLSNYSVDYILNRSDDKYIK